MRWLKRIAVGLVGVLVVLAVTMVAASAWLDTDSGKAWLAAAINRVAAGRAQATGIGGRLPFHPVIGRIELVDLDGVWASLRDVNLDLAPRDLLRRRLTVDSLSVAAIEVLRPPIPATPAAARAPASEPPAGRSLSLPSLPLDVDVRSFSLGSVALPAGMFGEPTAWTVTAAARVVGRGVRLDLDVVELDATPARAELRFDLSPSQAGVQANVDDPRGLLLRRQLGEALPLRLRIADDDASVPHEPADWRGRLSAALGERARLEASLHLAADRDAVVFETDGELDGARLLPANLAPLLGASLGFHVAARDIEEGGLSLDELRLHSDAFQAEGNALYRSRDNLVEASLRLGLPDLAPLSDMIGQPLAGTANVTLDAKGPLEALRAELQLQGGGLAVAGTAANEASARVVATVLSDHGYRVEGDGRLAGLRAGTEPLAGHLGDDVTWRLVATSDAVFEKLALTELAVSSAGLKLAGDGSLDRRSRDVNAALQLIVAALEGLADPAVPGLKGHGQIDVTADGNLSGAATVSLRGRLDDLATGMPAADALIGGKLRLAGNAARGGDGKVRLDKASLTLANARLTAGGETDLATRELSANFAVSVDDLSVLRQAGMAASGRLGLDGQLRGTLDAPVLDAHADGANLAWQTARLDRASARLQAKAADAPSASLHADLQSQGLAVTVDGEGGLSRDRKTLTVPLLRVKAGASTLEARLRTALDTLLTSGQVSGTVPDLRPWSPLAGMALGGRADLKLALSAERGQAVEFSLAGHDLSAGAPGAEPAGIKQVAASGRLSDVLRRPAGTIELTAGGVTASGAHIRELRLTSRSRQPDRFAFDVDVDGNYKGPIALTTGGEIVLDHGTTRATVARLNGRVADTPVRFERPLQISARGPALSLADLAVAVGDGRLTGAVKLDERSLAVDLDGHALPVGLGAHFAGRDDVSGALDISVNLAGPAAQPRGRLSVDGRDLRAGPARRGAATLGFTASADVAPAQVAVGLTLKTAGTSLLSASGTLPVAFGPRPGMATLADSRDMALQVRGEGDLARLADFLPLGGDRLAGHFRLAMDAAGPPARPQVAGSLTLEQGRYESLATGLLLDAVAIDVAGDRNRIVLRRLDATDGATGRLSGSGAVSFAAATAPALDLTATLTGFQALRRSDASLTASGSTTITGAATAPIVVARLTVDKAEIFIPDPPPSAAKKIPVTVIDSSTGAVLQRPEEAMASSGGGAATLDIAVHVPGRTFVRGRGLDSEWQGDVQVRGTSAAPEVTGALKVVKGKFSFFGKDMALSRGTVTFTGGHKIEPVIDVLADTTTSDATFHVGATGTPADLKITLSSEPAMPQDEILSRLIFGREMTKLNPAQGVQLAQAAATLSSGGPGMLDKVRHKLGLDVLNIGSMDQNDSLQPSRRTDSTGGNGGMTNTGVSGGKYIASGIYVGAEQGLSGETRSKVEIEVLPHVNVESSAGTRSEGMGVNWKMDY